MYGCVYVVVIGSDRIRGACVCVKSEIKRSDQKIKGAEPSRRLGPQTYGGSGRGGRGLRKTPVSSTKSAKALPPASVPRM